MSEKTSARKTELTVSDTDRLQNANTEDDTKRAATLLGLDIAPPDPTTAAADAPVSVPSPAVQPATDAPTTGASAPASTPSVASELTLSPPARPPAPGFADTLIRGFAAYCGTTSEKLAQCTPVHAFRDNGQDVLAFTCQRGSKGQFSCKYHMFVTPQGIPTGHGRWAPVAQKGIFGGATLKDYEAEDDVIVTGSIANAVAFQSQGRPAIAIPNWEGWHEPYALELLRGKVIRIFGETERDVGEMMAVFAPSAVLERSTIAVPQWTPAERSRLRDVTAACISAPVACAFEKAQPAKVRFAELKARLQAEHLVRCSGLIEDNDVLGRLGRDLEQLGFTGYTKEAQLIFMGLTSRVLDRPISIFVKGSSATGKSHLIDTVKRFFPPEAYFAVSSFTPKALVNCEEDFSHRIIIVTELDGCDSKDCAYTLRTLLSENKLVHMASSGSTTHPKEKPGPTGLMLTSTKLNWNEENETRMLSVTMPDDSAHTQLVLEAIGRTAAGETNPEAVDFDAWCEFQRMLDAGRPWKVIVPFAPALSLLIPPVACRLRRDFNVLLTMIKVNALVHYAQRETMAGVLFTTLDDYESVQRKFGGLFAETVENTVPRRVRSIVAAVREIMEAGSVNGASVNALVQKLSRDKGGISRRVKEAVGLGFLAICEGSNNRSKRIVLRDPLPEDRTLLPTRQQVEAKWQEMQAARSEAVAETDKQPPVAAEGTTDKAA